MDKANDQRGPDVRADIGGWISGPCLDRPLNQPHGMTQDEASALFHLRCTWGDRYQVSYSGDVWRAARLGAFADFSLTGDTAEELQGLIGEDYATWQAGARRQQS
jgi:hypothetical protein